MTGTPWQARRNLHGNIQVIDIHGDDAKLNDLLDRLEYCAGMEVMDRKDEETEGRGVLFVSTKRTQELFSIVRELGLDIGVRVPNIDGVATELKT